MRRFVRGFLKAFSLTALCLVAVNPPSARANGYLWLTSEYRGGNLYRYNIQTGAIDLTVSPALPSGANHWNNGATDTRNLYLGTPTTQYFGIADAYTGIVHTHKVYSTVLGGHKEDGAFHYDLGTLWRVAYSSGELFETTTDGGLVRRFTGLPSNMVGLEWMDDTLYGTNYSGRDIGTISLQGAEAKFHVIPWAAGKAPDGSTAGLAFDPLDRVLYMVTDKHVLYTVTFANGLASANPVVDLSTVGYPSGGLVDGMGWVAPECPSIIRQPLSRFLSPGESVSFSVVAGGRGTLIYQWLRNGEALSDGERFTGARTPTLTISASETADLGSYTVVVTSDIEACGDATSEAAALIVPTREHAADALRIAGGLAAATSADRALLDTTGDGRIDLADAAEIMRWAAS